MTKHRGDPEMSSKKTILFLVGPTAVGKTEHGIRLAQRLNTEIVSADSMQIYQYMDIGTGKPTLKERSLVRHHLVDFVHPTEAYSVGRYKKDADAVIQTLHHAGKIPLVIGGTGLYIRALTDGLFEGPEADADLRKRFKDLALKEGSNALYERLKGVDPESSNRIHPNDERRLIRALEVFEITGKPISILQKEEKKIREEEYRIIMIGLTTSRNRLYLNIENRVDRMIAMGLVNEVKNLLKMGVPMDSVSMQGLGYKEILPYLKKQITLNQSVEILKQETRHFAKHQMTWFKAEPRIQWLDIGTSGSLENSLEILIHLVQKNLNDLVLLPSSG